MTNELVSTDINRKTILVIKDLADQGHLSGGFEEAMVVVEEKRMKRLKPDDKRELRVMEGGTEERTR